MIKEEIQNAVINAMKGKLVIELKVLRFVLSLIQYEEINKQKKLTEEETVSVLRKEIKKRKEAIELFKQGNRQELVADEEAQIKIIERYLPQQMSDIDLERVVDGVMSSNEKSMANMGKMIGAVLEKVKGQADGAKVAYMVKKKLQSTKP